MAFAAQHQGISGRARRPPKGHNPLAAPLLVFTAVIAVAATYVAYVLWPRWPETRVAVDAPALPIVVAGVQLNIEPAAIRQAVQRKPGMQERIDLNYLWPSLKPPDPALRAINDVPVNPNGRLFLTIQSSDGTLPLMERVQTIYPRYLVPQPQPGPDGLTLRGFRDDTPYKGEELVFDSKTPQRFLARCSRKGVTSSVVNSAGNCLLERRIGDADIMIRFPRDWLNDWQALAQGIDGLMARLHPN